MKRIIFFLLLIYSSSVFAKDLDLPSEISLTPLEINQLFEEQVKEDMNNLPDLVDKEVKVSLCMENYIKKQSKSYSKLVQNNLYDLINNFDRITSRISGKKQTLDEIPYGDKIEALARVQCEAYYTMGVLK